MLDFFPSREVIVDLSGWSVRWYGFFYVAAFWLTWWLLPRLQRLRAVSLNRDQWTYATALLAGGALVGGRVGYVLFYEPVYFWFHPLDVFQLWQGGMSSHGGFVGAAVILWHLSRKYKVSFLALADLVTVPAAVGLLMGRIGNYINQELYQSYWQPVTKNLILSAVSVSLLRRSRREGIVVAYFLLLYSSLRFLTEFTRLQDYPLVWGLSRGQWLTLPIAAGGTYLLWIINKRK